MDNYNIKVKKMQYNLCNNFLTLRNNNVVT